MEYKSLGPSGLKVSKISLGNWLNGHDPAVQQKLSDQILVEALKLGINYFDTAENYGSGAAEIQLGKSIKASGVKREEIVVSTKLFWGKMESKAPNSFGLSRKHIVEGMNKSLKRLQLDYVDVVLAHRPDLESPIEETVRAFAHLIKKKKAFYWGTSEWTAEQITKAIEICDQFNLPKPIVEQPQYNLLVRDKMEVELRRLFEAKLIGSCVFSPLCGGILTGKYIEGIPDDSRISKAPERLKNIFYDSVYFDPSIFPARSAALKKMKEMAEKKNASLSQLCLAWVLKAEDVSTAIIGVRNVEQLHENIKAIDVSNSLSQKDLIEIEDLIKTRPDSKTNYISYKPFEPRR